MSQSKKQKLKTDEGRREPSPTVLVAVPAGPAIEQRTWLIAGVLFLLCMVFFWPAQANEFVYYDDQAYIHHNPPVRNGLTFDGIVWAITSVKTYYWQPLTWISHMIDVTLFGIDPAGHHLVSMLLHALNAAVLFLALHSLSGMLWPSAAAAALHALHPLRVESVAWAAERKDVLSGLFFALTLLAYSYYVRSGSRRNYWLFLLAAAAAYASKPTVVVLPLILLALDWWPLDRLKVSSIADLLREKIPVFAMSAGVALLTIAGQREKAMFTLESLPLDLRIWNSLRGYTNYLEKFLYPVNLGVFYPHEAIEDAERVGMLLLIAAISAAAWMLRNKAGYLLTGWLWFLIGIVPTSGLAQSGEQAFADRFTYIPGIGLALIAAYGVAQFLRARPLPPAAVAAAAAIVLGALGSLSWAQTTHWKNTETMAKRAIAVTDKNPNMHFLLGEFYVSQNRIDDAIAEYRKLIAEYPDFGEQQLANALMRKKQYAEAIEHYNIAIRQKPSDMENHKLRALALMQVGRRAEAAADLQLVLKVNPSDPYANQWLKSLGGLEAQPAAAPAK